MVFFNKGVSEPKKALPLQALFGHRPIEILN